MPPLRSLPAFFCAVILIVGTSPALAAETKATTKSKSESAKKGKTAHGAIAWHRESGSVGYSYDFATERQAGVAALDQCANARCEVVVTLKNECGAVADGPKGFKAQKGYTRAEAETKALKACGAGCKPVAWACTR